MTQSENVLRSPALRFRSSPLIPRVNSTELSSAARALHLNPTMNSSDDWRALSMIDSRKDATVRPPGSVPLSEQC